MDCKNCNIYRVQRYIRNNIEHYDILSKCGKCIAENCNGLEEEKSEMQ